MNLLFEWKNKNIKVKTLNRIPQIKDNKIDYIEKEHIIEIPIWMAIILKEHNLIEFLDEKNFETAALDKILWRENNSPNILPLEDGFYLRIKEHLRILSKKIKEYPAPQLIEEKQKTEHFLDDLLKSRLYKILRIVEEKNQGVLIKSLNNEEKILFNKIMSVFNNWKSELLLEKD